MRWPEGHVPFPTPVLTGSGSTGKLSTNGYPDETTNILEESPNNRQARLTAAYSEAGQQLGGELDWTPLVNAGTTNALFSAQRDGRPLLLRVNAPDDVAFGVDRAAEARLLTAIGDSPWAPEVLAIDPALGWLVMPCYVAVHPVAEGTPGPDALLAAVTDWQQRSWPLEPIRYDTLLARYRDALPHLKDHPVDLLARAINALPALAPTLVHHDLHAGNLLFTADGVKVLDWEYGGVGNPWFDLAALHQRFGIDTQRLHRLPSATGLSFVGLQQGLRLANGISGLLDALWYRVRTDRQEGTLEAEIESAAQRLHQMLGVA